jgi:hypothetical protein
LGKILQQGNNSLGNITTVGKYLQHNSFENTTIKFGKYQSGNIPTTLDLKIITKECPRSKISQISAQN